MLTIERIIYNPPATIVFWNDGTKTIAKCEYGDIYTKEMGFMLCVLKKKYGNKTFHDMLHKYVYDVPDVPNKDGMIVWSKEEEKKRKAKTKTFTIKSDEDLIDFFDALVYAMLYDDAKLKRSKNNAFCED